MARLFIEVLCEEIPARMQQKGAREFLEALQQELKSLDLSFPEGSFLSGPRRLIVTIEDLPLSIPDRTIERRGPRVDGGEGPLQGFLSSTGLSKEQLEIRETPKGTFYYAQLKSKGGILKDHLPGIVEKAIKSISWPAAMTWAWGTTPWVRPLKSLMCFLDTEALTFEISFGEDPQAPRIQSGSKTQGHRFLYQGIIEITDPKDYESSLEKAYVLVDQEKRKKLIWRQAQDLAQEKNLKIVEDPQLLDEVTGLVEWPTVMIGTIEDVFMTLPEEVLMTSMRVHQRYFSLQNEEGRLAPYFLFVANIPGKDGGDAIVCGNERVLRARLSDALFFYTQDQKKPLPEYAPGLDKITFHGKLGTLGQKTKRLQDLSSYLVESCFLKGAEKARDASVAASLCKLDLMTDMVKEFPELQGIMGTYYARHQGYKLEICDVIRDHYLPKLVTDPCPKTGIGKAVALADRLDTLVGFFGVGIHPTGSKDPFALRRGILGIVRILESGVSISLPDVFSKAYDFYEGILTVSKQETLRALQDFFEERLKVYWRDQGLSLGCIQGLIKRSFVQPLCDVKDSVMALESLLLTDQGSSLVSSYKRAAHILGKNNSQEKINREIFQESTEHALYEVFIKTVEGVEHSLEQKDFKGSLNYLVALQHPMDAFFTDVMIMSDDLALRHNRMALLQGIKELFEKIADFSSIENV